MFVRVVEIVRCLWGACVIGVKFVLFLCDLCNSCMVFGGLFLYLCEALRLLCDLLCGVCAVGVLML